MVSTGMKLSLVLTICMSVLARVQGKAAKVEASVNPRNARVSIPQPTNDEAIDLSKVEPSVNYETGSDGLGGFSPLNGMPFKGNNWLSPLSKIPLFGNNGNQPSKNGVPNSQSQSQSQSQYPSNGQSKPSTKNEFQLPGIDNLPQQLLPLLKGIPFYGNNGNQPKGASNGQSQSQSQSQYSSNGRPSAPSSPWSNSPIEGLLNQASPLNSYLSEPLSILGKFGNSGKGDSFPGNVKVPLNLNENGNSNKGSPYLGDVKLPLYRNGNRKLIDGVSSPEGVGVRLGPRRYGKSKRGGLSVGDKGSPLSVNERIN